MKLKLQTQVISVVLITGVALVLAGTAYYWGVPLLEKTRKSVELQDAESFMNQLIKDIIEASETGNSKIIEIELKGKLTIDPEKDEIYYEVKAPTVYYPVTTYVPLTDTPPFKKRVVVFQDLSSNEVPELNSTAVNVCKFELDCSNKVFREKTESQCSFKGDTPNLDVFSNGEYIESVDGETRYLVVTSYCDPYKIGYLEDTSEEKIAGIKGINKPLVLLVKAKQDYAQENFVNYYRIVSREVVDGDTKSGYYIDIVNNRGKIYKEGGRAKIVISRVDSEILPGESSLGGDLNIIKVEVEVQ